MNGKAEIVKDEFLAVGEACNLYSDLLHVKREKLLYIYIYGFSIDGTLIHVSASNVRQLR